MIKAVLFDFGGVLTPGGGSGSIQRIFAQIYGVESDNINIDDLHSQLRRGLIDDNEFFAEVNRRHPGNIQATKEAFMAAGDVFVKSEAVYAMAASLREHGIKTGILSNIYDMTAEVLRRDGYYDGFDPIILSYEENLAKPDTELYERAITKTGVHSEEILFIDDQQKCIPPAESLGIHTIIAVSPEQIVADTKALILQQNGLVL